ncbi:hypothetical protein TVAG_021080 [Trichomonas vaginalis G3]|uniref:BAR domain-containing protein n=1 Tax=Trichomonas vaginalis (strain ATCC PRA-98 / G3) TaxID=412133 RepID=A2DH90_TRIV3|nr:arfaptin homology (AH) domain/bar domain domain-containing protein [Trichomonas vaginalis G3]EAY20163.1 hypothetical protein TVAG_021080 [Trichomonas vaginalis G3]KAI5507644.1 arfaptin homology (AH) domain/bar domain domain-containing protein [Trichomonas vaginalis G3]|eukprot:XP_001581149.1 hypothetical protein [Trichomonas vaginalis G3]
MKKLIEATKNVFSKRDPSEFDKAKKIYKGLGKNVKEALVSLGQLNKNVDKMSAKIIELAKGFKKADDGKNPNITNQVNCILLFSERVNHITTDFFDTEIDQKVNVPIDLFAKEYARLKFLYKKRKSTLKLVENAQNECINLRKQTGVQPVALERVDKELTRLNLRFAQIDEDFIKTTYRLKAQKSYQVIKNPTIALSQIMSQYLKLVFKEMTDMRVAFPPQIFQSESANFQQNIIFSQNQQYIQNAVPAPNPYDEL